MANFIATSAIELESFPTEAAVLGIVTDDLDDAIKAAEKRNTFIMQAYQQVVMGKISVAAVQHDRALPCLIGIAMAMRNEGSSRELPEQFVQSFGSRGILRAEYRTYAVLHSLVAQLAGGAQLIVGSGVEIYFGHKWKRG